MGVIHLQAQIFFLSMLSFFYRQKLAFITIVYWFLLIYIVAALVFWYIELNQQNAQMFSYRLEELNKSDPLYTQKLRQINDEQERKTMQYTGEGVTFLLLMLLGAVFVYRATKKQILLSQQQQNFMMAVTHELKTPISVTQLNLETLQKRKLDEQLQNKLILQALQETKRLNGLTNNILTAAQLEANSYILNKQQINFSTLLKEGLNDFITRFSERKIYSNIEDDIYVDGEFQLLRMLINNLLDNAFKYSSKERSIHVILERSEGKAVVQIIDEGEGVPDNEKKKIFEKFYRGGDEATRTAKGTGLGLYLCKKIVDDHKGQITVKDNIPHGCIFIVTLNAV